MFVYFSYFLCFAFGVFAIQIQIKSTGPPIQIQSTGPPPAAQNANTVYGTTNTVYGTTNADARVGIGLKGGFEHLGKTCH